MVLDTDSTTPSITEDVWSCSSSKGFPTGVPSMPPRHPSAWTKESYPSLAETGESQLAMHGCPSLSSKSSTHAFADNYVCSQKLDPSNEQDWCSLVASRRAHERAMKRAGVIGGATEQ